MSTVLSLALAITLSASGFVPPPPPPSEATTTLIGQRYGVTATLDVALGRLDAVLTLEATNQAALPIGHLNLSVLPRAFGYYAATGQPSVDGEPVTPAWTTTTNLRLPLPRSLERGATATIRLPFRLTVGSSGGAFTARTSRDRGVLSFGQWLPMVSPEHSIYAVGDPRITRTAERIRIELTTTAALPRDAVACPGLTEAPRDTGTRWVCEIANARDFSFVVNPRFRLTERVVNGIVLRVHTETVDGARTAALATQALTRLEDLYGPYPWPDLVLAEVGADAGFSMEYPAAIHLTRSKVADPYVVYHEVAHQWFYAQVGNDQMNEPWLDEGFADFTARYLMGIGENQCSTRAIDSPVFAWPAGATSGGDWLSCDGYFHAVFYRTTEFLNAVRAAMGDAAFFSAVREHVAAHRFEMTTAPQLLDRLQAASSVDLRPIYARYLSAS